MDPVCHTLVGATLGATGLEKQTRLGRATLILAANLPDVDGLTYFSGPAAYAYRRGLTHGLPAMLVLPVVLACAVHAWARVWPAPAPQQQTSFRWLLLLSTLGVVSHPALDWLNSYGMRWLMPFVDRWFYGDTLFIVDPVLWLVLGAGLLAARRGHAGVSWIKRPASLALAIACAYIGASYTLTQMAERTVTERLRENQPQRVLASPVPLNPFERAIVLEYPTEYRFGTVRFGVLPRFEWLDTRIPKGPPEALDQARATRVGRWFLGWARFPYAVIRTAGNTTVLHLADARYVRDIDAAPREFGLIALELTN
jgi:inner membrane protein